MPLWGWKSLRLPKSRMPMMLCCLKCVSRTIALAVALDILRHVDK
jgi:hypothetical protein